ncbi:MAG: DUF1844 domain-containing protein [Deltaproteobacteria bacterium]|nr:DUF1844 domain-containing protein [Deltaproteobacteria bacterium]
MEEETKGKGFVVRDRRLFDESGDVRKGEPTPAQDKAPDTGDEKKKQEAEEPEKKMADESLPEIDFSGFILSLSTSALYHFGDFPDPETKRSEKNLPAAKQITDILGMLKTKTEGNLDEREKSLLEGLLYDLRMRYVREKAGK